jgi:myo-inositol-1(or 4)-monophosphatase
MQRELHAAIRLALEAGVTLRHYQAGAEPVTAATLESEAIIRAGLEHAFADDALFFEATAESPERFSKRRVWIVDPLDSESSFTEHGDEYCVSIGLAVEGRATLGVVYNPARDEMFAGYDGAGVTLNRSPARVSDAFDIESARITVSGRQWQRWLGNPAATLAVIPLASMAYKLARVAAGLDDAVFSLAPREEWGTCAGVALVLAAGGRATLLDGREIRFNRREPRQPLGMVASCPRLHRPLLETLRGPHYRDPAARLDDDHD